MNRITKTKEGAAYLWLATRSSSFFTPLRLSAPNLTRKDRQCKRSSAGTPLNLQLKIVDYMI